jgi:hypothetical protein
LSKRKQYEMPAELRVAQERFTEWRSSHGGRKAIPAALWKLASDLASEHGICRTAQALRLDYTKLKRQMLAAASAAKASSARPATFVELTAPASPHVCECVIEIEGPRGRMRIEWKGSAPPDLASLSQTLWEPGA